MDFYFFLLLVSHLLQHHDESHRTINISKTSFFWTNKFFPDFYLMARLIRVIYLLQ